MATKTYLYQPDRKYTKQGAFLTDEDENMLDSAEVKTDSTVKEITISDNKLQTDTHNSEPDESSSASPVDVMIGDVNGDNKILADDARLALRASAKLEDLNEKQLIAADVNGDKKVLADDARQILRYSAKLQTEFTKAKNTN